MSLIERVESAVGADREIDAEIALALGIVRERDGACFYGHRDHSVLVLERDYYDHGGHPPELPHYTASLDAAMTLVPEGWLWVGGNSVTLKAAMAVAPDGDTDPAYATAATPALALCAASLRARGIE